MRTLLLIAILTTPLAAEDPTLQLRDAQGTVVASLIPRTDGFRIVDPGGTALGEAVASEDRVRLVDDRGAEVLSVVRAQSGAEVRNASGGIEYTLRQEGDEQRVKDAAGADTGRLRPAPGGGFEYLARDEKLVAKVTAREDRVRYEDASGTLASELQGTVDAKPWAWLALDRLSVAERVAIATYFLKVAR